MKNRLWIYPVCILGVALVAWLFAGKVFFYISANFLQFKNLFWAIAFAWSTFLALYAFQIDNKFFAEDSEKVERGYGKIRWSRRIHQFIFHFSASFVGWLMLYTFLYTSHLSDFAGWEKLLFLIVAFMAITGYMPYTLIIKSWLPSK